MKKNEGYVLILVFFVISLCTAIVIDVIQRSMIYQNKVYFALEREKARLLALSGIQIALSQVSFIQKEKKENQITDEVKNNVNQKDKSLEKKWFDKLLPIINKWQKFDIKEKSEGIIQLYITSEQGKIDLNYLTQSLTQKKDEIQKEKSKNESEKKTFTMLLNEYFQKELKINLIQSLKEIEKKLGKKIDDPSEFLILPEFKKIKDDIFVPLSLKKSEKKLYLMDLFTLLNSSGRLNPWFLSNSVAHLLGFQTPEKINIDTLKEQFKPSIDWSKEWDKILAPIYGKNFESIEQGIKDMFASQFELTSFSIICYATVGSATQRLYALLVKDKENNKSNDQSQSVIFKIARLYWF